MAMVLFCLQKYKHRVSGTIFDKIAGLQDCRMWISWFVAHKNYMPMFWYIGPSAPTPKNGVSVRFWQMVHLPLKIEHQSPGPMWQRRQIEASTVRFWM